MILIETNMHGAENQTWEIPPQSETNSVGSEPDSW